MENDRKETLKDVEKRIDDRFEDQSLKEQSTEILAYLDSAHPAQTIVPQGRVDLLRRSLKRFGEIQKQIDELAAFLLAEFPTEIAEGSAVDNAIRLLKRTTRKPSWRRWTS